MSERMCRFCGCTEHRACLDPVDGPCWWIADDVCSHCELATRALGIKIRVASDVGSALVSIETRHAAQLQKMLGYAADRPAEQLELIRSAVEGLAASAVE